MALRQATTLLPRRITQHNLDKETGSVVYSHTGRYYAAIAAPSLPIAILQNGDDAARVWQSDSDQLLGTYRSQGAVMQMAFSSDDKLFATASFDHSVRVWGSNYG